MSSAEHGGDDESAPPKLTSMGERSRACDRLLAYLEECINLADASGDGQAVALLSTVRDRVHAMRPATLH